MSEQNIPSYAPDPEIPSGFQAPDDLHPILGSRGRPVWRSQTRSGPVPGARLSSEARNRLREELRLINIAETAVRGSDVIVYTK